MERQTKHRILGVLVLLGLVVILLPFFQTSNELPSETALVNSPPFPDEAAKATNNEPSLTQEIASEPIPLTVTTAPLMTPIDESPAVAETEKPVIQAPVAAPAPVAAAEVQKIRLEDLPEGSVKDTADTAPAPAKVAMTQHKAKSAKSTTTQHVARKSRSRMVDGYQVLDPADLAGKTWAVQLGSFKSKSNAMRLVSALRTRGYRTFTQQASSDKHGLTKVLVGPERKKDSAHSLAAKLEKDVHIRGVVVNYKPFAL